jgi:hypothetical protein
MGLDDQELVPERERGAKTIRVRVIQLEPGGVG